MSEFKLNLLNRLHLIWEIITTRSGHKHSSSSKQLSTFQQGYSAGVEDERCNTKDLERQLEEAREAFRLVNLENQLLHEEVNRLNENINERQLAEAREIAEDAINEINTDPLVGEQFTVLELYERLDKLKEKGESED